MSNIFYVKDADGNLVPAQFMNSPNGTGFIRDPNDINVNPINSQNGRYYDASGNDLGNINPNNYFVVPKDFNINSVISFGEYVGGLDRSQKYVVMFDSFNRGGQWDLQRSYTDIDGNYKQGGTPVPMFQDAASYVLGVASAPAGVELEAMVGGGAINWVASLGEKRMDTSGFLWNNPRNVISFYAGTKQAGIVDAPDTPLNPSTRNSDDYISDTSANDHQVIIKTDGRVWDAYVSQKNSDHGFKNWDDFKAAVAISNPDIADLNKIDAGTTLMMPEKFADGSVTYNFAGGTSINSNAVTGEYHMVVQNADGGQTVYSRTADGDAGYSVHQVSTDKEGNITSEYNGYQATLDSEVKPISLDWKTPTETGQADWGDDGSYQTTVSSMGDDSNERTETTTQYNPEGQEVGAFTTQHDSNTAASDELLSTELMPVLEQNTSYEEQVLDAAEIRAIAGVQGADEGWGGGRMLDASDGELGSSYEGLGLVNGFDLGNGACNQPLLKLAA